MTIADGLPDHAQGKSLEVWFQDKARVGQQSTVTRIWAPHGSQPHAPRDTRCTSAYSFGIVCPERGVTSTLVMPHAETQAMSAHLVESSHTFAEGAYPVLVFDRAGWHG